jgi:hypothetical protein
MINWTGNYTVKSNSHSKSILALLLIILFVFPIICQKEIPDLGMKWENTDKYKQKKKKKHTKSYHIEKLQNLTT